MRPVSDELDEESTYSYPALLLTTPTARIYTMRCSGKTVCVKAPAADSGLLIDMLKREYTIGVGLSHPCIASYLRWDATTPVGPGIVMEFVDGCRLDEWLAERPSLAARNRIFGQLLDVVEYLHGCGIMHNDLKPANIMVSRVSRSIKLLDFGFADNDANTLQRLMGGTKGYASPELISGDIGSDARSDIYSLGMIMRDIYGRRYGAIARHCRRKNPERRYSSVAQLRKAWMRRRRRPLHILVAMLIVMLAAAIGWGVMQQQRSYKIADEAATQVGNLRDSLDVLNSQLTDIARREEQRALILEEYEREIEAMARRMNDTIRRTNDMTKLLYLIAHTYPNHQKIKDRINQRYPEEGPDIIAVYGPTMAEKLFAKVRVNFDRKMDKLREEMMNASATQ